MADMGDKEIDLAVEMMAAVNRVLNEEPDKSKAFAILVA
jgi:hypothetical protein